MRGVDLPILPAEPPVPEPLDFDPRPEGFTHWRLAVEGDVARLVMAVQEDRGLAGDYVLKLNSYDLGVDIELAAALQHLRFSRPEVRCLVITGALERVFCSGANIMMLRQSAHAFKVNFCKFTNETRLYLEDASAHSGLKSLAALNGTASGGGYELALACDRILLVDDRNSAVSFPEMPLLGVLPGTGGLTRLVDKRQVRRDRADVFSAIAEGIKGKRAVEWDLVDELVPLSRFDEAVGRSARELADASPAVPAGQGVALPKLAPRIGRDALEYEHVRVAFDRPARTAAITLTAPAEAGPREAAAAHALGGAWWPLAAFRELDDALLRLRLAELSLGTITLHTRGDPEVVLAIDALLASAGGDAGTPGSHWFVRETRLLVQRVLKRLDLTARSLFAVVDEGSCFAGTLLELALAADRSYVLNDADHPVRLGVSALNGGSYLMGNGLSRLASRFLGEPGRVGEILSEPGVFDAERADELGLATAAPDAIDWEDELRLALEERAAFSPDALTGMEANLRFAGPETMETKIFGRLSAWQNWIFQRPNAVGEHGALKCYGTPNRPDFDWTRT
ncbi:MAG TPA: 2,3-epoxybenzoyl-CoA dihydrolase [Planctomycetota bacterium]|nr:2,3-epoxybenzoyl-CoA dihydrolase [Planctomycetota bacterium]